MKIRPVGAELFHVVEQIDRHDEADSRFSQFCQRALKERLSVIIYLGMAVTHRPLVMSRLCPDENPEMFAT
jgi:hypothetical protein